MQNSLIGSVTTDLNELAESYRKLADDLERFATEGTASITSQVMISEWFVAKRAVPALIGMMRGHPNIKNGNAGLTTELVFWDENLCVARSMNRWYRLGRPFLHASGTSQ
ncbi:UNVERIFIED_ORG: hypothetical protein J2W85_002441 [Ensifer adhaerens]|nr:hypothetical protein [Ensifer adhaerens]